MWTTLNGFLVLAELRKINDRAADMSNVMGIDKVELREVTFAFFLSVRSMVVVAQSASASMATVIFHPSPRVQSNCQTKHRYYPPRGVSWPIDQKIPMRPQQPVWSLRVHLLSDRSPHQPCRQDGSLLPPSTPLPTSFFSLFLPLLRPYHLHRIHRLLLSYRLPNAPLLAISTKDRRLQTYFQDLTRQRRVLEVKQKILSLALSRT